MDHCDSVDINNLVSVGFLCEFDENTVKFFTVEHGVVELENQDGEYLELAAMYDICDGTYEYKDLELGICKPYVKDEVVYVNTLAIGPNEWDLPRAIRRKYQMKVWSPYLGYLNDASDIFRDNVKGGVVREVVCKFAPSAEGTFEIVDYIAEVVERSTAAARLAPWTIESISLNLEHTALPEGFYKLTARNQFNRPDLSQRCIGICIFHSAKNVAARKSGEHGKGGSKELCSYIFSPNMGMVRWTHGGDIAMSVPHPELHEKVQTNEDDDKGDTRELHHRLGTWVSFTVNDAHHKMENRNNPVKPSIYRLTATRVQQFTDPPKISRVVGGNVEIDASFIFNHDKLEDLESREIEHWGVRMQQLRKDAHFWDFDLGKVEIYPTIARQIIENIENYRASLTPELRERIKDYAIVVHGTTRVLKSWLENWLSYPKHGIFFMDQINIICYLNGGATIYRREGFQGK